MRTPVVALTPIAERGADSLAGLSEAEAATALTAFGPNELPRSRGRSLPRVVFDAIREPMFLLLLTATILYLVLGDLAEGLFLTAGACASVGLTIFQEARSERALRALRDMAQPQARVIRGGVERTIPSHELVPGDLMLVGEGQRLPADGLVVAGDVLGVDESALTGESSPVSKRPLRPGEAVDPDAPAGAEEGPHLYSGALVVRGQAVARVSRTGARTALGQIGASLAAMKPEPTPLQRTAGRLVGLLGALAIGFGVAVAAAYGLVRGDWVAGVLAGITVAISLIPEEFPMVLAVFLALGAWRLATHRVLVRHSAVIEALGGATVLCVDKTGTLTENRMRVARLWTPAEALDPSELAAADGPARELLRVAGLASAPRPIDPMDRAIRSELDGLAVGSPAAFLERSWPLRTDLMAVVQVWRLGGEVRDAAAKGAPEAIFKLCRLSPDEIQPLETVIHGLALTGLRVLGVASCRQEAALPEEPTAAAFHFEGLIGFLDPVREDVPAALQEARAAGVAVVMITGDHPATALAIARTAGIDTTAGVILGSDLATMTPSVLRERLRESRVFARIAPDQKLMLVRALQAEGHVVAMTGDGVNDAPALEAAEIGIAMGRRGSDVAREAADLVLMDDSFAAIVGGVRLGRRIFANLRRALVYLAAVHVPIAGVALAPILLGMPPLLFPMHVVLLELAIDPTCAMVFEVEPSEARAMRRPPRRRDEALFGARQLGFALLQGFVVLSAVLGVYRFALGVCPEAEARGAAFTTLVVGNLALALADSMAADGRLFAAHRRIYWVIGTAAAAALAMVLAVPGIAGVFRLATPPALLLLASLVIGAVAGGWMAIARILGVRASS